MNINQYDDILRTTDWLAQRDLPVVLTLTEILEPSGGTGTILFPPTYARKGGDHPYAISEFNHGLSAQEAALKGLEANSCDVDSVGAQANRMENEFAEHKELKSLVPQIVIKAGSQHVNLLTIGHRVADGAVRFSELSEEAAKAIADLRLNQDATALARLAPTSLVFGFWDSRGSQYKYPRLVSSVIRATNVAVLKRSAQFNPAFDGAHLVDDSEGVAKTEMPEATSQEPKVKDEKNPLSQEGLLSAPAVDTHGGVRVFGRIVRQTEVNLVALRAVTVTKDGEIDELETLKLRRYLLGLSLIAARVQQSYNLRQGCSLVLQEGSALDALSVRPSGQREPFAWDFAAVYAFAVDAAKDFGIYAESPKIKEYDFKPAKIKDALKAKEAKKAPKKEAKKASA